MKFGLKKSLHITAIVMYIGLTICFVSGGANMLERSVSTYGTDHIMKYIFYGTFLTYLALPLFFAVKGITKKDADITLPSIYLGFWPCFLGILLTPYKYGTLSGSFHIIFTRAVVFLALFYMLKETFRIKNMKMVLLLFIFVAGLTISALSTSELGVARLMGLGEYILIMAMIAWVQLLVVLKKDPPAQDIVPNN